MTDKIYIDNIQKITKTGEFRKKLPQIPPEKNKSKILGNRGIGYASAGEIYNPCQKLYDANSGRYTFADLVDGVAGPKKQDSAYNYCDQLNTITGLRETNSSPVKYMQLKPDGVFIPVSNTSYWYTTLWCLFSYTYEYSIPGMSAIFNENLWAFSTPENAAEASRQINAIRSSYLYGGDYISTVAIGDLVTTTITEEQLHSYTYDNIDHGAFNFKTTYPLAFYTIVINSISNPPRAITDYVFGLPFDYNFTIDTPSSGGSILYVECPFSNMDLGVEPPFPAPVFESMTQQAVEEPLPTPGETVTFLLALESVSGLWKANPEDLEATPLKYHNGVSIVAFDFGPTYNRKGEIHPAKDGGFMLYETSAGMPINNVYVYRRDRTLFNVVPASQIAAFYP